MSKLFALFPDDETLQTAIDQLHRDDYEVISSSADESIVPEVTVPAVPAPSAFGAGGMLTQPVPPPHHRHFEAELEYLGLDASNRRVFADALKNGSQVLVVKRGNPKIAEHLKASGASYVFP